MNLTLNDLTVSPQGLDRDTLLESWQWLLPKRAKPVLITALGDVFVQDGRGAVHFLDTCAGTVTKIAENGEAFTARLHETGFVTEHMYPAKIVELRDAGLNLTSGTCYSHKQFLVLGGQDTVDNYEVCSIAIHLDLTGHIHQQVKDLPDGTKIAGFEMKPKERKPWWKIK
jgi:hypothetical protein